MFIDSDDVFYDTDSVKKLFDAIHRKEMAVGPILVEEKASIRIDEHHEGCLHGKMYRRSIIEKNNLRFNSLRSHEDNAFNNLYELCCDKIAFVGDIVYRYKYTPNSITMAMDEKESLMAYIDSMTWLCKEIQKRNIKHLEHVGRCMCIVLYYCYFNYLSNPYELSFVFDKMAKIKKLYNKYISTVSDEHIIYLYRNIEYNFAVIPTMTVFDFIDNIKDN